jgi:hypothetical protein
MRCWPRPPRASLVRGWTLLSLGQFDWSCLMVSPTVLLGPRSLIKFLLPRSAGQFMGPLANGSTLQSDRKTTRSFPLLPRSWFQYSKPALTDVHSPNLGPPKARKPSHLETVIAGRKLKLAREIARWNTTTPLCLMQWEPACTAIIASRTALPYREVSLAAMLGTQVARSGSND